jgi:hypothetical protein
LERNVQIVLAALKPAHVLYSYSHLFTDAFDTIASDTDGLSWDLDSYYYDDTRKWCLGAKTISSNGSTLEVRTLFSDPTVSFASVRVGSRLKLETGSNKGEYAVREVITFPFGADPVARLYTTSPSGLSGSLLVLSADTAGDNTQDWGLAVDGELLTIAEGPNAGTYRLDTLLGTSGGPVGVAAGPATTVRCSPGILKVDRRMPVAASAQPYTVDVDRLGVRVPHTITGEDAAEQFYL